MMASIIQGNPEAWEARPQPEIARAAPAAGPAVQLSVVVPTYNEHDNIRPLVELLTAALSGLEWQVIFVDDDSADGTADVVRELAGDDPRVRLVHRVGRRGLAGACVEGMLAADAPLVAVMDADLQHDEMRLAPMYRRMAEDPQIDVVVGSRNVAGGSSGQGLSQLRKWASDRANGMARRLLGITVTDPMSGFFMIRRASLNEVVCGLQPQGFKILADLLSASGGRWKVVEMPYVFRERRSGPSKMSAAVALEFLALMIARLTGGVLPVRFVLFLFVGLSGVFVQLAVVRLAMGLFGGGFGLAQALGISVAMTTNFALNNVLTYRDRSLRGRAFLRGLVSFYAVCSVGALANLVVAEAFFRLTSHWAIASLAGAIAGAVWNFWASLVVTWRAR